MCLLSAGNRGGRGPLLLRLEGASRVRRERGSLDHGDPRMVAFTPSAYNALPRCSRSVGVLTLINWEGLNAYSQPRCMHSSSMRPVSGGSTKTSEARSEETDWEKKYGGPT